MSLHDILMERANIHFQNAGMGPNVLPPSNLWQNIGESVSRRLEEDRKTREAERKSEENNRKQIENFKKLSSGDDGSTGKLIPSLKMKEDGNFETTAHTPTPSERKSIYEMDQTKGFIADVQSGVDANTLRLKYPTMIDQIDTLQIAGTIKSGGIQDTVKIDGQVIDTAPQAIEGQIDIEGTKFVPKGLDELGRVTGYERVGSSESEKKRNLEVTELDSSIKNLVDAFSQANAEAKKVENQGKSGLEGRIAGKIASIKGAMGESPAVNVYNLRRKAFATTVAKAAGEVRPTDEDIKRFVDTLMNPELSDEENQLLMEGLINDLRSRGSKAVWAERVGGYNSASSPTQKKIGRFIVEVE